jgi:hypothetical protein
MQTDADALQRKKCESGLHLAVLATTTISVASLGISWNVNNLNCLENYAIVILGEFLA